MPVRLAGLTRRIGSPFSNRITPTNYSDTATVAHMSTNPNGPVFNPFGSRVSVYPEHIG